MSMMTSSTMIDSRELRRALGEFATGVTVVSYDDAGVSRAVTVNSFTSVSLDPPIVLISLALGGTAASNIPGKSFAVNVLDAQQHDVAMRFAGKAPSAPPIEWDRTGIAPRLPHSLASFVCLPWAQHEAGDHLLVLGYVESFESAPGDALVFHRGRFQSLDLV